MADDANTQRLLGELISANRTAVETIRGMDATIKGLTHEVNLNNMAFQRLESGLQHANNDLKMLKESQLTPNHLRQLGLDLDHAAESRADLQFIRSQRVAAEARKPVWQHARNVFVGAMVLAGAGWVMNVAANAINQPPSSATPHKGP